MKKVQYTFVLVPMIFFFNGCFFPVEGPSVAIKYLDSHSDMTEQEIRNFAWHGNIDQERLLELANSPSYEVRKLVARNKNLPADHLEQMLKDHSWKVVLACIKNPNLTAAMQKTLIHHKSYKVRAAMATDEKLSLEDLITLTGDKSAIVRGQAARNPRLPEAEMRRLFIESTAVKHRWDTEERSVQAGLAANENVPMDILEALSRIGDPVVTTEVAENPNTPEDILMELSKNKYEPVRNKALQRLQMKNILPQQFNFDED